MIIFCLSNLSVPTVLSLCIEQQAFVIYTDQPNIEQFFTELFGKSKVKFIPSPPIIAPNLSLFVGYKKMSKYKKQLLSILGVPKDEIIYFFHNAFGYPASWWIQKVSKSNIIYYKPDVDVSMWKLKLTITSVLHVLYIKFLWSITTAPMWSGNRYFFKVTERFLRKNGITVLDDITIKSSEIKNLVSAEFSIQGMQILMLSGDTVANKLVEEQEYILKNDLIIEQLGAEKISIKVHPRFVFLYSKEEKCAAIPSYVPANVIMDSFDVFIGYSSAVLFEAANKRKVAISLLDVFIPMVEERRESYRKYLTDNLAAGRKIFYPKSVKELVAIIKKEVAL